MEFCQDREHSEHCRAFGFGGVEVLFEHPQAGASFLEGGTEDDIDAWHGCEARQLPLVAESAPELPSVVRQ